MLLRLLEYDTNLRTIVYWEVRKDLSLPDFILLEAKGLAKIVHGKPVVRVEATIRKAEDCKAIWNGLGSKNNPVADPVALQGKYPQA